MGKYFGTDGFRGEANVVLTVEHAFKVGRYLGWYFGQEHKARIVIGKDTRRSSYMFEYALAAGLTASGADAYLLHVTTTPSVSYVVRTEDFDCGIMISASHNPFYDNGIKVINGAGHKIEAEVEQEVEAYIDGEVEELPLATGESIGRTIDYAAGRNRYIGHLISVATRSFKDMRVGLDCSNGSASSIAKSVYDALGAKTFVINSEPDGTNINTNCGSTHIEILQQYAKDNKLDVAFAFDGDADRCIAVDENGSVVDGDLILYVCGKYLMEQGRLEGNTIVTTIMSNLGLYKACDKIGMKYEQTAVGDKYVYENMLQNGFVLGGEQSGHVIFSKHARTGDGILTSLMIMEVIMEKKMSLGKLTEEVQIYPQLLKNVRVTDKTVARENPAMKAAVDSVAAALGDDGRILVRESGTEPVIRVMVEAATDEICEKYVDQVIKVIEAEGLCAN
ncbi:phosphoglucosamine mutase [Hespellia stercorisuis]|uniref:Phosphoglucosamine mutase n=1 Tax=Hespellia stercorisuis DSM 15480 TaxID=1121950 RepID=A0A1M6NYL6_9FIRM|nr:phosphoglucosamine mutase [Hespellia stercorisuis]SHK00783.1 phosphoglucosamine mutase [Hespellia stercorisuis DSM 15480]